jgi:hypothetical protein
MAGRTLAAAQADYNSVHEAWLKALKAESYSQGGKSVGRSKSKELYDQMMVLDSEIKRLSRGGMRVRSIETDTDG